MDVNIIQRSIRNEFSKNSKMALTVYLYLLMFAYALSVTMIGPLMPVLIQQYNLKMSYGGLILTFQSVGGVLAITLGGILADIIKKYTLIRIAFIAYSLSLVTISVLPSYTLLLVLFFILGASTRMLDSVTNAYISDLHPDRRGLFITLLHTFFGVGAFAGPIFSTSLIDSNIKWTRVFFILGITCVLIMLSSFFFRNPSSYENTKNKIRLKDYLNLIASPRMLILCLIMFMYAGDQSGISTWLPMYMQKHLGTGVILSGYAVSAFWIGIILGRLTCSFISARLNTKYVILIGSLLGGTSLILGILSNEPYVLAAAAGVTGYLTGAIIPLLVLTACGWYPKNSGTATSMLFFYCTMAWMVIPWFIGVIAETTSFEWGMLVTGITLLVIVVLTMMIPRASGGSNPASVIPERS